MDYRKTAQEIYDHIGKKENIISAAHCATRLRLVISDNSKADLVHCLHLLQDWGLRELA